MTHDSLLMTHDSFLMTHDSLLMTHYYAGSEREAMLNVNDLRRNTTLASGVPCLLIYDLPTGTYLLVSLSCPTAYLLLAYLQVP